MKTFFGKLGAVLRRTWVWSLLLVLLLAVVVWFVGPLLAVDDYRFWESSTARLLSISVLFLGWGLAMVFASWRASAREKRDAEDQDVQEQLRRDGLIGEEQQELLPSLQAGTAHAEDLQPLSRAQREMAQRAALVPVDRSAG